MGVPPHPITPTQQAINGAMDIFVEGHLTDNIPRMLIGLTVLRSATESQVQTAMRLEQAVRPLSLARIQAMLAWPQPTP